MTDISPLPFDRAEALAQLDDTIDGADNGELYIECSRNEGFVFDDGRLRSTIYDAGYGSITDLWLAS